MTEFTKDGIYKLDLPEIDALLNSTQRLNLPWGWDKPENLAAATLGHVAIIARCANAIKAANGRVPGTFDIIRAGHTGAGQVIGRDHATAGYSSAWNGKFHFSQRLEAARLVVKETGKPVTVAIEMVPKLVEPQRLEPQRPKWSIPPHPLDGLSPSKGYAEKPDPGTRQLPEPQEEVRGPDWAIDAANWTVPVGHPSQPVDAPPRQQQEKPLTDEQVRQYHRTGLTATETRRREKEK